MKNGNLSQRFLLFTLLTIVGHFSLGKPANRRSADSAKTGASATYIAQLEESYLIAAELMKKTNSLDEVSDKLRSEYHHNRTKWINLLKSGPPVVSSSRRLYVGELEKAALADEARRSIVLNIPYWKEHPLTMVQSVILAVHESGHLLSLPISHEELDEIGFSLILQNQTGPKESNHQRNQNTRLCVQGRKDGNGTFESYRKEAEDKEETDEDDDDKHAYYFPPENELLIKPAIKNLERYALKSKIPNIVVLGETLLNKVREGQQQFPKSWATEPVMNITNEIAKSYVTFHKEKIEELLSMMPSQREPRPSAKVLAEAQQLRTLLKSELKPFNLKEVYDAQIALKEVLAQELPPHDPVAYKNFFTSFLEKVKAQRAVSLQFVEKQLIEANPYFGATSDKDLEQKLLSNLDTIIYNLDEFEKSPEGRSKNALPMKEFRKFFYQLEARSFIWQTARYAELVKKNINLTQPDFNKMINDSWGLYNNIENGDQKTFYNKAITDVIRNSRLATEGLWIPDVHKYLDGMAEQFSQNNLAEGLMTLDSIISHLKSLQIKPSPAAMKIISSIQSQRRSESVSEESSRLKKLMANIQKFLASDFTPYDFEEIYHLIAREVIILYHDRGTPKDIYKKVQILYDHDREFKWFVNFMRIIQYELGYTEERREQLAYNSKLIWCQDFKDLHF
ncbi:MAG: hypothetical protein JNM39_06040 [Bdellovibrionaceae bacterium]|nr:hypothetical protein [Pseudobdellovibrionaceae bacterium]